MSDIASRLYGETAGGTLAGADVLPSSPAPAGAASSGGLADRLYKSATRQAVASAPVAPATAPAANPAPTADVEASKPAAEAKPPAAVQPNANGIAIPEHIAKMRAEDGTRRIYPAQTTFRDVPLEEFFGAVEGSTPERSAALAGELREIYADMGATLEDIRDIGNAVAGIAEQPTPETLAGWEKDARAALAERYDPDAGAKLQAAQALVKRDPRVAQILDQTGLGNHPAFVLKLVELADRRRGA